ncbi:MAG TPA: glycogen/starch/alpha-glucan phosphorylase [Thermoanaerobaculia bacterium]|nr:glycogen/starch/alpha-glucan phosphorylase [Thermoanaerobaculia bacterium]
MKKRIPKPEAGELSVRGVIESLARRMTYSVVRDEYTATNFDVFKGLGLAVRDQIVERWFSTQEHYYKTDAKRVYYLSLEFLLGRTMISNMINLGALGIYREAMEELGYDLDVLAEEEPDAGLGNGGLGRLAACFLDSAASLDIPFYGYGIRYEYGIFRQHFENGFQVETPDNWLRYGNPWEVARPDVLFPIRFYGRSSTRVEDGKTRYDWADTQEVWAMAHDIPVLGYRNDTVNTLRLWAAKSSREFDLAKFNAGDYVRAVEHKNQTENISKVLYPPDDQYAGKELRLKQQYFFVSATMQDVIRRFRKRRAARPWSELPEKVAVQLNDTHPAIAIPELMRILVDQEHLEWEQAWPIVERTFSYTNHTILAEALEAWPIEFFGRLLPRHLQIIEEIDRRTRNGVRARYGDDPARVARMAVIDDASRSVRMSTLAIVGSHSVNGVAKLHTDILRTSIFPEFDDYFPGKFNNKTNGITPRRWLMQSNPALASLIRESIGEDWCHDLGELRQLEPHADDPAFRERWHAIKLENKRKFSWWLEQKELLFDPDLLLDTQIKRIHEYKRQLLNALHVIHLYNRIQDGEEIVPRTVLFGGKAAPAYFIAKLIIKLVNEIAELVRHDPRATGRLQVLFVPNYDVTCAERIYPASELSEQTSTAGTEASGTGNMKAALNGSLIIGTLDGANIEIREHIGDENMFVFGHTAAEIAALRTSGYDPKAWLAKDPALTRAIETIVSGPIGRKNPGTFQPLVDIVTTNDRYFHCADFASYVAKQDEAAALWAARDEWLRRSILSVARMGWFSSDRTIREYADRIWGAPSVNHRG